MNLLKKKWLNIKGLNVKYTNDKMIIENNTGNHKFLIYPKIFIANKTKSISIKTKGNVISGQGCRFEIINRHKKILGTCGLNSVFQFNYEFLKYYIIALYVPCYSKIEVESINYDEKYDLELFLDDFNNDTLLLTPGYPSLENKYNCAFVHTRVQAYKKSGMNVDVLCVRDTHDISMHEFENVKVITSDFYYLRRLLQKRKYKRILIHFFNEKFANVFETVDVSDTFLYFYLHGAETLYRDWPKFASPYFEPECEIDDNLESLFKEKDYYVKKYSKFKNAKWVFVTPWTKQRCEELLDVQFENSDVCPCLIDTELFSYQKKDPQLRKKIFLLRKFDNLNSYSIDTAVRVVLELSHRSFFNDLEFDFYGDGSEHEKLLEPISNLENVHIHRKFLSHEQIRKVHETHGIALFPTRFDSQAVSSCEACSSGCAVISSDIPGVRQFIPKELGVLCDSENPKQYADVIEKMYYDTEYFQKVGHLESMSVSSKYDYEHTIQYDIDMFTKETDKISTIDLSKVDESPTLSIVIPSYNVEKFLRGTVVSMMDQRNVGKIEIIIVNDGSKDKTAEIGKELEILGTNSVRNIVRLINKENGGHGSTINVGLKEAKGKYFKVVDGDDTVDSEEFAKLIDILERSESDVVLNNYIQDFAAENNSIIVEQYKELKPEIEYLFDDLCYPNYGFQQFGPVMSCSSYKTDKLREASVKLPEKMFYVDMVLNTFIALNFNTVIYYPLNVYRYMLGSTTQSVSTESYIKHYMDHENVCIHMAELYMEKSDSISKERNDFIMKKLIIPMMIFQYNLVISKRNDVKAFKSFDNRLKQFPEIYNNKEIVMKKVYFHRLTGGIFMPFEPILEKINLIFNRSK